jgi:hypothetical protein
MGPKQSKHSAYPFRHILVSRFPSENPRAVIDGLVEAKLFDNMALAAGTRLGPYKILAPVGAGGMGEV